MKAKKYYIKEEINSMDIDQLRELVGEQQEEIQKLLWSIKDTKELLIAAIQSLPKTIEL